MEVVSGSSWSYKTYAKAPVKMSPSTNQQCQSTEGKMTINLKNSLVEGSSNLWLFMTVD